MRIPTAFVVPMTALLLAIGAASYAQDSKQSPSPLQAAADGSLSNEEIRALILGKKVSFMARAGARVEWKVAADGSIQGFAGGNSDRTLKPLYEKDGQLCSEWRNWNSVCPLKIVRRGGALWMTTVSSGDVEITVSE
jgi:hypothetical protein